MSYVEITVEDTRGTRTVEVPDDVPVNRILTVLVDKLNLPKNGYDGLPQSYKFHHQATKRQLLDEETLRDAGVANGDVVRLQAEITPGGQYGSKG